MEGMNNQFLKLNLTDEKISVIPLDNEIVEN